MMPLGKEVVKDGAVGAADLGLVRCTAIRTRRRWGSGLALRTALLKASIEVPPAGLPFRQFGSGHLGASFEPKGALSCSQGTYRLAFHT